MAPRNRSRATEDGWTPPPDTSLLLRQYFRSRRAQLLAASTQAVAEHAGLRGDHREDLIRIYLREIVPRRFEMGRGMTYGFAHRSQEADIVVWDASNFPTLRMSGHQLFFAETVRLVIEVKTRWTSHEWVDIRQKCRSVKDIVPMTEPNLVDDLTMIQLEIESLKSGRTHQGMLLLQPHIGTAAVVFHGHSRLSPSSTDLNEVDDAWPDALLLLEQGLVVLKSYDEGVGRLDFIRAGQDGLLVFTHAILSLITERTVQVEGPLRLGRYAFRVFDELRGSSIEFPLTRPPSGRRVLWG